MFSFSPHLVPLSPLAPRCPPQQHLPLVKHSNIMSKTCFKSLVWFYLTSIYSTLVLLGTWCWDCRLLSSAVCVLGGCTCGCCLVSGGFLSLCWLCIAALFVLDEDFAHELCGARDLLTWFQLDVTNKEPCWWLSYDAQAQQHIKWNTVHQHANLIVDLVCACIKPLHTKFNVITCADCTTTVN